MTNKLNIPIKNQADLDYFVLFYDHQINLFLEELYPKFKEHECFNFYLQDKYYFTITSYKFKNNKLYDMYDNTYLFTELFSFIENQLIKEEYEQLKIELLMLKKIELNKKKVKV